jgi:hypothetical protein
MTDERSQFERLAIALPPMNVDRRQFDADGDSAPVDIDIAEQINTTRPRIVRRSRDYFPAGRFAKLPERVPIQRRIRFDDLRHGYRQALRTASNSAT